jgi:hypothetical protein
VENGGRIKYGEEEDENGRLMGREEKLAIIIKGFWDQMRMLRGDSEGRLFVGDEDGVLSRQNSSSRQKEQNKSTK